jgi:geranylgeranylglycerol-phosphate geranylgeranyltransferase
VAYLRIIRPVNCIITSISVLVGGWIAKEISFSGDLLVAALVGFTVCAFGNLINDIKDIEIDRINNPMRPLPSGRAKKSIIWVMASASMVISAAASFFLGTIPFLVVITALVLLIFYSLYLKKTVFGNITVALTAGLSFVFGGVISNNMFSLVPAIFSILIHMPREILKDVMDMKGDRMTGAVTLPILVGPVHAYNISAIFLGILCLMLPIPYITGMLGAAYIILILAGAYPLLIYLIWMLLKKPAINTLPLLSNLIKASMIVGLAAMIIS